MRSISCERASHDPNLCTQGLEETIENNQSLSLEMQNAMPPTPNLQEILQPSSATTCYLPANDLVSCDEPLRTWPDSITGLSSNVYQTDYVPQPLTVFSATSDPYDTSVTTAANCTTPHPSPSECGFQPTTLPELATVEAINEMVIGQPSTTDNPMIDTSTYRSPQSKTKKPQGGEFAYSCTFPGCPKEFPKKQNLLSHIRCHSDERPHVCAQCSACFRRKHDLQRHFRSRHAVSKPHHCSYCGKPFARTDGLRRHLVARESRGACG
ncbi:uncharacterized protein SPPG_05478 [Spizellomyces punctatus DAOM BR117]|uniref:C2H2-type domain-containing protein n=1 Tax=Spizellomyces punctatus (strain DAOM BR117) TaxID=645134 RepID=A0A0L0HDL7_SPIPD|nr:uncharacterized protein SPPG_05478 [Spizellomyces punctatus DAOM BR117]KNC99222.1 hypothetical protein SPPG_05478 [Spizellomyces punctatus DAOM BR117]|eukprot:XP_016607262.1 hypothetical protein SPPG_05478 [Spizellomyces punctatus DAOM BR117]